MDKQTGKLIARIAENLPDMDSTIMQGWIDNPKGLQSFLGGLNPKKVEPTRSWREEDGVIYFSVTSDGTTGEDWTKRLKSLGGHTNQVLRSPDFKPTNGVTTEVAVLKGMLFEGNDRITSKIRAEADKRKFEKPNAELACLIREKFTDKEIEAMGLAWIITMHEPIKNFRGVPLLLDVGRDDGGRFLGAFSDWPDGRWGRGGGFAFAVSQVSVQS